MSVTYQSIHRVCAIQREIPVEVVVVEMGGGGGGAFFRATLAPALPFLCEDRFVLPCLDSLPVFELSPDLFFKLLPRPRPCPICVYVCVDITI